MATRQRRHYRHVVAFVVWLIIAPRSAGRCSCVRALPGGRAVYQFVIALAGAERTHRLKLASPLGISPLLTTDRAAAAVSGIFQSTNKLRIAVAAAQQQYDVANARCLCRCVVVAVSLVVEFVRSSQCYYSKNRGGLQTFVDTEHYSSVTASRTSATEGTFGIV